MYWNCDSNKLMCLQVRSIIWFLLLCFVELLPFYFLFIFIKLCLCLEWLEEKDLHVVMGLYIHFLLGHAFVLFFFSFPNCSIVFSFHVVYLFYFDLIPLRIECSRGLDSRWHDLLLIWFLMLCQIMRFRKVVFWLFYALQLVL